jgi:hypothetical protein
LAASQIEGKQAEHVIPQDIPAVLIVLMQAALVIVARQFFDRVPHIH